MTERLTLISRAGCHLCEVAEQTLDRIAQSGELRIGFVAGQARRCDASEAIDTSGPSAPPF